MGPGCWGGGVGKVLWVLNGMHGGKENNGWKVDKGWEE